MINNYLKNQKSASKEVRKDAIMGTVLLHSFGYEKEFVKYINQIDAIDENESFLFYLKAIASITMNDFQKAKIYATQAMETEPQAIEPVMIMIMALDGLGKYEQAFEMEEWIETNWDDDHYKTPYSSMTAYNLLGDIAYYHELPQKAAKFHKKALEQLDYFFTDNQKAMICLKIASDYHLFGSKRYANEYYQKAIGYAEEKTLKKTINRFYNEEVKTMKVLR